jgi:uncharacterized membrane protein YjjP (DUF1212 family)
MRSCAALSWPAEMSPAETQRARTEFVVDLARRLHAYGTSSPRLEGAIMQVAQRLGLQCEAWSNPTGIILSFGGGIGPDGGPENTRVLRLEPGEIDLRKLCAADAIAERVMAGELDVQSGRDGLRALDRRPGRRARALTVFSFGLTSGSVAALLQTGWADIVTAASIGWMIGLLSLVAADRPRLAEAFDAVSALLAALIALAVASFIAPLALKSVLVAAVIVLLPGLTLTIAVAELSSQHLVSGTARFAGAVVVLLKLAFGTVAGLQIGGLLGWQAVEAVPVALPGWVEWVALGCAGYAFAVLFKADRRDIPLVIAAACLAYLATRFAGRALGNEAGVFFAGLLVSALSNLYGRIANRPGAVLRLPGIILLVPGSIGFRSLSSGFERDVLLSIDTGFTLLAVLIALVAGLLFGNLLIPPRGNL